MMKKLKYVGVILGILAMLLLAACGSDSDSAANESEENETDNDEENYSELLDYRITGIEPGAGVSVRTEMAIEEYDSLQGWEVDLSSTGAMFTELRSAYENEEPIIFTGWSPHWMFAEFPDMKYLEDPKDIYGGEGVIHSIARLGLAEEQPEAYQIIKQYNWTVEDMEGIMYDAEQTGQSIEELSAQWVLDNEEKVAEWTDGVADVDGVDIELVSIQWDSEVASANVLKNAMEPKGFNITITEVDGAVLFEALASGSADATIAAWLPITHKEHYERHEENLDDLGQNLVGARIGLVVPGYMDIDSIEDLEAK